jgi:hypothetical protein
VAPVFTLDELSLALKRIERDHQYRVFVTRPAEWAVVRSKRDEWLQRLADRLAAGTYVPSPAPVADIPKGKGAVRSTCLLSLVDEVVYTAAVGRVVPALEEALKWAAPHPDCSYLLRKPQKAEWISNPFAAGKIWRERSLKLLDAPAQLVVVADITSFYDSIHHEVLLSDLKSAKVEPELAHYIVGPLLGRWAIVNGRGIPQGLSASDLLAKLYLNVVDHAIAAASHSHLRWVDDFRIFCDSASGARKALLLLQTLLRNRGLALQSAKTHVLRPDKAKSQFEGIQPVLQPLAKKFVASIAKAAGLPDDYLPPAEAAKLLSEMKAPPTDLLREAYESHLIAEASDFNKTIFRYLLSQLGRAKDTFALEHAISLLVEHPEETSAVLTYISRIQRVSASDEPILARLLASESIYPYQHYQFLIWRLTQDVQAPESVLKHARDIASAPRSPAYLVSAARLLLGRFGSASDLEILKAQYAATESEGARVDLVAALQRMESGQRNASYGQWAKDGDAIASAVQLAKGPGFSFVPPAG